MELALAADARLRCAARTPEQPVACTVAGRARWRRYPAAPAAPGSGTRSAGRGERFGLLPGRPVRVGRRLSLLGALHPGGTGLRGDRVAGLRARPAGRRPARNARRAGQGAVLLPGHGPAVGGTGRALARDALRVPGRAGARVPLRDLRPGEVRLLPLRAPRSFVVHVVRLYGGAARMSVSPAWGS
ncbi:hypothetical protein GCM10027289_25120 [Tsukamurella serpentis]